MFDKCDSIGNSLPQDPIVPSVFLEVGTTLGEDSGRNTDEAIEAFDLIEDDVALDRADDSSLLSLYEHGNLSLPEEALHGLPGRVVREIDPYTEADPAAVLAQLLCVLGNCIGPTATIGMGNTFHPPRINVLIVGATAKARKGTSLNCVRQLIAAADPGYSANCTVSGASSGEGIINAFKSHGDEKRLLLVEEEFAGVLSKMHREGNVLSEVIRESFDRGDLAITTKNNPMRVEGAHLSVIGHITARELIKCLGKVELVNGFANRLLWIKASRSKLLVDGSMVPTELIDDLATSVRDALQSARGKRQLAFGEDAKIAWKRIYEELEEEEVHEEIDGVTSRGSTMTYRMALIYALMDSKDAIGVAHVNAAYALWRYSRQCIMEIFDVGGVSNRAAKVLGCLSNEWMSRTMITKATANHISGKDLDAVLNELKFRDLIEIEVQRTGGRSCASARKKAK